MLPNAYAASVAATQDILQAAAVLSPKLGLPVPLWRVVSLEGGLVPLSSGLQIETQRMPLKKTRASAIWVVPGLGINDSADLSLRLTEPAAQRMASLVKTHVIAGGTVAASCTAVFLLQAAGLLKGRRATTSWWLSAALRKLEPECRVDADRMLISDGPVITAGAAFAQTDLMLHLLRKRCGAGLSSAVGKVLLLDGRQAQSSFVVPAMLVNGDELIGQMMRYIESILPKTPSVVELASKFAMSPRTLSRHVRAETGQSPLALIQSVRLNRARTLLESSRMPVDQVAQAVGYSDATALRRLMHKASAGKPSSFRDSSHEQ